MRSETILLVDDNPDDIFLTIHAFKKSKITHEIIVANEGIAALDLLLPADGRPPLKPAIVLLDINMPKLGGLEVLARLRADPLTRALPVIMLTTSTDESDIVESYDHGANSYVQKPVTAEDFLTTAKLLGVYWLGLNIPPIPQVS